MNNKEKKLFVKSYGCQMNVYDSNRIFDIFDKRGFVKTEEIKNADIIVLNTCHIREKAAEKLYSDIGRIKKIKKNIDDNFKLIVAGCVAQAEGEEIKKRAPLVDFIVGPQSYHKLPEMIDFSSNIINDEFLQNEKFKNLIFKSSNEVSEFITIQEGCDKFCKFCVVPYTRGSEFSRSVSEILKEIKIYLKNDIKEVILLGQNVNAYHGIGDSGKQVDLSYLINKISEFENIKRIRYMTSHPNDMSDSLINCHGDNEKLMPFLHLPIQSGSDFILKKMNRKHDVDKYLQIINKLKSKRSDIAISSDFIVGFPEESEEDFLKTLEIIDKVKFTIAYSFMYSPRPGTPAANLKQIDLSIKKTRLQKVQDHLKKYQKLFNDSHINKKLDVLFDKKGRHKNQFVGRSIYNQSVFAKSEKDIIGKNIKVNINRTTDFALEGSINEI